MIHPIALTYVFGCRQVLQIPGDVEAGEIFPVERVDMIDMPAVRASRINRQKLVTKKYRNTLLLSAPPRGIPSQHPLIVGPLPLPISCFVLIEMPFAIFAVIFRGALRVRCSSNLLLGVLFFSPIWVDVFRALSAALGIQFHRVFAFPRPRVFTKMIPCRHSALFFISAMTTPAAEIARNLLVFAKPVAAL